MKVSGDVRCEPTCPICRELCSFIHIYGFAFAIKATRAKLLDDRIMRGFWVSVCPTCDAYLLMREFTWGVPFYSARDMAVVSIADYSGDAVPRLEFGNLPFTLNALRSALHLGEQRSTRDDDDRVAPIDRCLLGPTGIPDDEGATDEWLRQLDALASTLPERSCRADLDSAVRRLIRQVPNWP